VAIRVEARLRDLRRPRTAPPSRTGQRERRGARGSLTLRAVTDLFGRGEGRSS